LATVGTYLNFAGTTEAAFELYRSVFGGEFVAPITRLGDAPGDPERPLADHERNMVMHVSLPILGGHVLMGTDVPDSMGFGLVQGNNVSITLQPDTLAEADRLWAGLSSGHAEEVSMQMMFWGDYFGTCVDRFGIRWMIVATPAAAPER
jgi:PhnB protein